MRKRATALVKAQLAQPVFEGLEFVVRNIDGSMTTVLLTGRPLGHERGDLKQAHAVDIMDAMSSDRCG